MNEEWRPASGYEGIYEVSNLGNVRSVSRTITDYRGFKRSKKGKIIHQGISISGYNIACLCNGKLTKEKQALVHRLVAQAFIPNPENKPQVNHIDGNKLNNHVENLEWATGSENQKHAVEHGLRVGLQGDKHPDAALTSEQVSEIRKKITNNEATLNELVNQYNLSYSTIYKAATGLKYKNCNTPPVVLSRKKYSDELANEICHERYTNNVSIEELAQQHNIAPSTVYMLLRRNHKA